MAGAWFHTTSVPATLLSLPASSAAFKRALEHYRRKQTRV